DLTDREYDALVPIQWPAAKARNFSGSAGTATAPATRESDRPFADGRFSTPTGKARMVAVTPRAPVNARSAPFPLALNTGRIRDQWHTMTRTARAARLLAHIGEPYVEVHPDDARAYGLRPGTLARL